ncbi:Fruiting body protein SC3 [Trametes pubescens]|uniref:Hydrophobin n=1 Tax=Trametes pubescens TaxID=154538 RepID=A0A1M2VHJ8_TRAPU|nr:Fruiting body protein SC3 [Trametes pubescens]
MFARLSITLTIASVALLAVATPNGKRWDTTTTSKAHTTPAPQPTKTVTVTAPASTPTSASQCSTGSVQCCNSVQSSSSPAASALLGLLGIVLEGIVADVGLGCSPISVIGVGGSSCSSNVVCCQDNSHGGLISIGCLPVTL